jgi:hypothetical protein
LRGMAALDADCDGLNDGYADVISKKFVQIDGLMTARRLREVAVYPNVDATESQIASLGLSSFERYDS